MMHHYISFNIINHSIESHQNTFFKDTSQNGSSIFPSPNKTCSNVTRNFDSWHLNGTPGAAREFCWRLLTCHHLFVVILFLKPWKQACQDVHSIKSLSSYYLKEVKAKQALFVIYETSPNHWNCQVACLEKPHGRQDWEDSSFAFILIGESPAVRRMKMTWYVFTRWDDNDGWMGGLDGFCENHGVTFSVAPHEKAAHRYPHDQKAPKRNPSTPQASPSVLWFIVGQKTHRKISQILQIFWNFSGLHGSQLWWLDMILHESCDIAHLFCIILWEKKGFKQSGTTVTPPCFSSREIFQSQVLEVPEISKWWRKCTVQSPVFLPSMFAMCLFHFFCPLSPLFLTKLRWVGWCGRMIPQCCRPATPSDFASCPGWSWAVKTFSLLQMCVYIYIYTYGVYIRIMYNRWNPLESVIHLENMKNHFQVVASLSHVTTCRTNTARERTA